MMEAEIEVELGAGHDGMFGHTSFVIAFLFIRGVGITDTVRRDSAWADSG